MKNQYKAGKGAPYKDKEAQKIGETCEKLQKEKKPITAETVLEEASNPKSCLHEHFDWDDSSAAHQFRLVQARKLVHHLRIMVEVDGEQIEKRAFAHITVEIDKEPQKAYVPTSIVDKKPEARVQVVQRAMAELNSWYEKYQHYEELSHVLEAVKKAYMDFYG